MKNRYEWRLKKLYWDIERFIYNHLKHRLKLCHGIEGPCFRRGKRRRQNTAYSEDRLNWTFLCDECMKENHKYWDGMWAE